MSLKSDIVPQFFLDFHNLDISEVLVIRRSLVMLTRAGKVEAG